VPVFMAHGTQDPVIPIALAQSSRATLEARGLPLQWRDYPMPHSVCAEEVGELSDWIKARFSSPIILA